MKVLIYSEFFLPAPGGAQTVVLELATGLTAWKPKDPDADSIEVTVVTRTKERMEAEDRLAFRLVRAPGLWRLIQLIREADVVHLAGPAMLPLASCFVLRKP